MSSGESGLLVRHFNALMQKRTSRIMQRSYVMRHPCPTPLSVNSTGFGQVSPILPLHVFSSRGDPMLEVKGK